MKKLVFAAVLIFSSLSVYSQKIALFEIAVYDNDGKTVPFLKRVNADMEDKLNKMWFDNRLSFETISKEKSGPVISSFDALKVCRINDIQYAVYGYVKKTDVNYFAEIKIYDALSEKILYTVFESDDLKNYDRLIKGLSEKIAGYFIDTLEIKTDRQLEEEKHVLQFDLPFSMNYWVPIDDEWNKVLLGVIGVNVGIDFYPEFNVLIRNNRKIDFNFRFDVSYKFGIGSPSYYNAYYHSVSAFAPVVMNWHLDDRNSLSLGFGPLYQFTAGQIEKKYENPSTYMQNETGLGFLLLYNYKLNEKWKLSFEVEGDLYFTDRSFFVVKPKIGAVWNFYKKNRVFSASREVEDVE